MPKLSTFVKCLSLLIGGMMLLPACQSDQPATKPEATPIATPVTAGNADKVQAVLKTQPFPYDNSDKIKITGDYQPQQTLTVPSDLAPQNKWVMFEGPVLENDLIAYRFYMDYRHRNDIYGKRVSELVMDTVGWDYHNIQDWGSDILKVNASLGIGSPAIFYKDSIYAFEKYAEKTVSITEDTNEKASIRMLFKRLDIAGQIIDVQQDWSIGAGQPWCEIQLKVLEGKLPEGAHFATGIVKHLAKAESNVINGCLYSYTWGKQSFHKENMGMAIIIDEEYMPEALDNKDSHIYVMKRADQQVHYRFMAAWERDVMGITTAADFEAKVKTACENL